MKSPLTIRLSPEARAALERMATRESRSLASWIEWHIRQEAQKQGAWSPQVVSRDQSDTG